MEINILKNITILYAEDDDDTRELTSNILEDYCDRLIVAKNGEQAFELFETYNIDIVLTDILMPKLSGIELARKIRNAQSNMDVPILITSAHTETKFLLDSINLGINAYLLKPINIEELILNLVKAILPKYQADELRKKNALIDAISIFMGGKKIEILKFLLTHCDKDNIYNGSYEDIMNGVGVSKPTVVKMFKQLIEVGLITKIKNKVYKIHKD